jgi:hypothetical protein
MPKYRHVAETLPVTSWAKRMIARRHAAPWVNSCSVTGSPSSGGPDVYTNSVSSRQRSAGSGVNDQPELRQAVGPDLRRLVRPRQRLSLRLKRSRGHAMALETNSNHDPVIAGYDQ